MGPLIAMNSPDGSGARFHLGYWFQRVQVALNALCQGSKKRDITISKYQFCTTVFNVL